MSRVQIVSILAMALLFVLVFELVRRRRLMERYALLWLFSAATLLMLAVWRNVLELFANAVGIFYAPSALFAIALGFVLMLLLHFSLVISRLADQSKVLAQRVGLLEREIDVLRMDRSLSEIERGGPGAERGGDRQTATLPAGDPPR
ncbi:MAG TPA: DUF2304 domain-containing protein [Solirubrobacteraceae bacterium]|nr:DUF2304 domain-containing protein [Solirubrobacteraceae bacterium]